MERIKHMQDQDIGQKKKKFYLLKHLISMVEIGKSVQIILKQEMIDLLHLMHKNILLNYILKVNHYQKKLKNLVKDIH